MDKDDAIKRITSELLEEIKNSNKSFSNEEVKEKINKKLDIFFNGEVNNENSLKTSLEEEDKILKNEFTRIADNEEDLSVLDFDAVENSDTNSISDNTNDKKEIGKKFFQEVADIYKNEFDNSLSCFKNAFESFKLIRKTSLFETILIFVFLAIPAILAGCIALIIVFILFLLWQLYLIIKSILELLKKAEFSIKGINERIRIKIKDFKNSGGFINRLILSNALYSLMMFNGVMYMLIKGLMVPVKSILDVEKIVANLLAKLEKGITTVLKSPSELALANTKTEAAKSRSGVEKQKESKTSNKVKQKERVVEKTKSVQKAQIKPQQQQVKKDQVSKVLHEGRLEVANAIAKNLQAETSQQKVQDIGEKAISLAERPERQQTPMSSMLSLPFGLGERDDMSSRILGSIVDAMRQPFENIVEGASGLVNRVDSQKNPETSKALNEARQEFQRQLKESETELLKAKESGYPNAIETAQISRDIAENNIKQLEEGSQNVQNLEQVQQLVQSVQKDDPIEYASRMDSIVYEDGSKLLPEGFSMEKFVADSKGLSSEEFTKEMVSQLNDRMTDLGYSKEEKEKVVAIVLEHQENLSKEIEESRGSEHLDRESKESQRVDRSFTDKVVERKEDSKELNIDI
ncbi:MAG: hypothetical protein PHY80_03790 [Rickettsiales bacterium]|nr:hypothetical protein [Rickettsiales bacterium]